MHVSPPPPPVGHRARTPQPGGYLPEPVARRCCFAAVSFSFSFFPCRRWRWPSRRSCSSLPLGGRRAGGHPSRPDFSSFFLQRLPVETKASIGLCPGAWNQHGCTAAAGGGERQPPPVNKPAGVEEAWPAPAPLPGWRKKRKDKPILGRNRRKSRGGSLARPSPSPPHPLLFVFPGE